MKTCWLYFLLLGCLQATELEYEIVDEIRTDTSKIERLYLLLEAYDAFSSVARAGTFSWTDSAGRHSIALPDATVACDPARFLVRIVVPGELGAEEIKSIDVGLHIAARKASSPRFYEANIVHQARLASLHEAFLAEKDLAKKAILGRLVQEQSSRLDGSPDPRPFGLRLIKPDPPSAARP